MNEKQKALRQLDAAIDGMDQDGIDRSLARLTALESHTIEAEDAKLFAARIKKLDRERKHSMKNKKTMRTVLVAAAIMVVASVGVYASGVLNNFTFADGDRITNVRTTESITETEAKELADNAKSAETAPSEQAREAESKEFTFDTVEEAEKKLDTKIVIPAKMPELALKSVSGQTIRWGDDMESRTVYAIYGDPESKAVGITVDKRIVKPGSEFTSISTSDMDKNSIGEYKSKSGKVYTLHSESDDSGKRTARIAKITAGSYEYALIFVGVEENEMHKIIDSADLSVYH
ncbi:hypothetical protein V6615_09990 [Oscillospiraceae bacterium PP1C4]